MPTSEDEILQTAEKVKAFRKNPREWLTINAYAHCFGVCRHTVYKWLREDLLETFQAGNVRRIKKIPPKQVGTPVHPVKRTR